MKKIYVALLAAVFSLIALLAATRIGDPDTMQYLASGRYMLAHGLEEGCVFNYSSERCQVVYPQWLFHVLVQIVHLAGSWNALVVLQVLIAAGVFAVVFAQQRRQGVHPLVTALVFLPAVMVARERFMLRADLFALLPAALLYYALERYADPSATTAARRRLLLVLGLIQVLWANTHGSFPLAFLLLGAFLLSSMLPHRRRALRRMLVACVIVVAASLVNPYGLKAFLQPFRFMLQGERMAPQIEFASPFAPTDLVHSTVLAYKVLLMVLAVVLVLSFRAIRVRDLLVLGPLLYLSLTSVRHIALFAVFSAILLPRYVEYLRERCERWLPGGVVAPTLAMLLLAAIAGIGYAAATDEIYRFDAISRRTGLGISDLVYPSAAADFVEANDLPGNMFNDYSVGTYLNWRLYPSTRTFIDGHGYTPERLAYYRQVMAGRVPHRQVVATYKVNYFLLSHKSSETRTLIQNLHRDSAWVLVHFDELAMIFVKLAPENQRVIDRYRIDLAASGFHAPAEPSSIRNAEDFYLGHTDRGLVLYSLGLDGKALLELEEAARENPRSFVTLTALGLLLEKRGDGKRALEACARAVAVRSGYAPGHFWLGVIHVRQRRAHEGIAELEKALRINSRMPLAHYHLGITFENLGDKRRALDHYRKEIEVNPLYQPAQAAARRLG